MAAMMKESIYMEGVYEDTRRTDFSPFVWRSFAGRDTYHFDALLGIDDIQGVLSFFLR